MTISSFFDKVVDDVDKICQSPLNLNASKCDHFSKLNIILPIIHWSHNQTKQI